MGIKISSANFGSAAQQQLTDKQKEDILANRHDPEWLKKFVADNVTNRFNYLKFLEGNSSNAALLKELLPPSVVAEIVQMDRNISLRIERLILIIKRLHIKSASSQVDSPTSEAA